MLRVVDLFFHPRDGMFRENRRGAGLRCTVADDQFIVFYPEDSAFRRGDGPRASARRTGIGLSDAAVDTFRYNAARVCFRPAVSR